MGQTTSQTTLATGDLADLLPETATTKSGLKFEPRVVPWHLEDGVFDLVFNFDHIPPHWTPLQTALQLVLLKFLRDGAPTSARNLFQHFLHFARATDPPTSDPVVIDVAQLQEYIVRIGEKDAYRVGALNVLLQQWGKAGYPGVTEECRNFLRARRKPGGPKGQPVRMHDPIDGPFTATEYLLLYRAIDNGYEAGSLPLWVFVLTRLLFATGQRTSQYASLKVCDVLPHSSDGYTIQIPLVKKGEIHSRVAFEDHSLSPQTAQLLDDYIAILKSQGASDQSALFPLAGKRKGNGLFAGHSSARELGRQFQLLVESLAPPTDRLDGASMPISVQRFRYTYGTRLAEEGASPIVIANRLGHTDLQHVGVYVEYSQGVAGNIDMKLDKYLIPIAQAFRGSLIQDEAHSTRKGATGSRIWDLKSAKAVVGSCGKDGGCAFRKPVACYTCFRFEPWLDAPHESLLQQLLKEREDHQSQGEPRLAEVNDDTILAVREVVALCAEAKASRGGSARL